jgi:hypothetical protein
LVLTSQNVHLIRPGLNLISTVAKHDVLAAAGIRVKVRRSLGNGFAQKFGTIEVVKEAKAPYRFAIGRGAVQCFRRVHR